MLEAMHDRIPPSLAWLVKRRKGLAGQLELARRSIQHRRDDLAQAERLADLEIAALSRHLEAVDQAIRLHQIIVDPTKLTSTRVQVNPRRSSYGGMTAAIYGALKGAAPKALTTDQVMAFVMGACDFGAVPEDYEDVRLKLRKRMRSLVAQGKITRLHAPYSGGHAQGLWCVAPSTSEPAASSSRI